MRSAFTCPNAASLHKSQPYPFARLPFDIGYLIWMESVGPIMHIVPLDKFEKVLERANHKKPSESVKHAGSYFQVGPS
jgi:hypothetical protein